MYDPLHIGGVDAVGFRWRNGNQCWMAITGATNQLCYVHSQSEWEHAAEKSQLFCSGDDTCFQFYDETFWNEEFVPDLCLDHGLTDKGTSAQICSWQADNDDLVSSLKLAILNKMYGTNESSNFCGYWCMYDPLHIGGDDAVGFKWRNTQQCWMAITGATDRLCYVLAHREWEYALEKSQLFYP